MLTSTSTLNATVLWVSGPLFTLRETSATTLLEDRGAACTLAAAKIGPQEAPPQTTASVCFSFRRHDQFGPGTTCADHELLALQTFTEHLRVTIQELKTVAWAHSPDRHILEK